MVVKRWYITAYMQVSVRCRVALSAEKCLTRARFSHFETVGPGRSGISQVSTCTFIRLTQIEIAGYFSSIFNYLEVLTLRTVHF